MKKRRNTRMMYHHCTVNHRFRFYILFDTRNSRRGIAQGILMSNLYYEILKIILTFSELLRILQAEIVIDKCDIKAHLKRILLFGSYSVIMSYNIFIQIFSALEYLGNFC